MAEKSAPFALVATYFTVEEAELNRAYLDASGLETHVDGAQIAGVLPLHVGATGGVKLLVRPGELAQARELLGLDQERPSRSPA